MLHIRKSEERGHINFGWLDTYHSFSFGSYYDPNFMGFRNLRVINQDVVLPKKGFDTHPHKDMEIISVILRGSIEHKDSMGNKKVIKAGEVQTMTAGTGVLHSEYNPSESEELELMQIWILPSRSGLTPSYEQKAFDDDDYRGQLKQIVGSNTDNGALKINQDIKLFRSKLSTGKELDYNLKPERHAWVQVISGAVEVNGKKLEAGDGLAVSELNKLNFSAQTDADFLLFDLN